MANHLDKMTIWRSTGAILAIALVLFLLLLPALQPFMLGKMPRTDDGNLHLYRSVVLAHSWDADGTLYPRYSSGLVYGYGAPLFNFFSPASYVLPALLGSMTGDFVDGWLWSMVLLLWIAAGGAYVLGAQWAGRTGGIVTAAAYVYAPYTLLDAVTRGTSSELAALALLPWAMWGFGRLAARGGRLHFVLATGCFALFIPMHNIITLHGTLLLIAYCGFLWLTASEKTRVFWQMLGAGVLAVTLTAFFWLPALTETDHTRIVGVTEALDFVDVTNSLRSAGTMLALPHRADPTQLQQEIPITLHGVAILAAGAGLLAGLFRVGTKTATTSDRQHLRLQLMLLLLTLVFMGVQLPLAAPLWKLPLLEFTQFAWRLTGLASLTLALLAGIGAVVVLRWIRSEWRKIGVLSGFLLVLVLYSIPWLITPYSTLEARTIADAQNYERATGELALSSYSEYLPAWTDGNLNADRLREAFQTEPDAVPRLRDHPQVRVIAAEWHGTQATIRFAAEEPSTLVFDWLYVPGWEARFTGTVAAALPLSVQPTDGTGLVSVDVPAGEHELRIQRQDTAQQQIANWLSVIAAGMLVGVLILWRRIQSPEMPQQATIDTIFERPALVWAAAAVIGIAALGIKAGIIDRTANPLRFERFAGAEPIDVELARNDRFAGIITLSAVTIPDAVESGGEAPFSLFWRLSDETVTTDYSSLVVLRDADGHEIARAQSFQPGNLATSNWLAGYYVEDRIMVTMPNYTLPLTYEVDVSLFDAATGEQLDVLNADGNPVSPSVTVDTVTVTNPAVQPPPDTEPLAADTLDFPVQLLAMSDLPERARIGDELEFSALWRIRAIPEDDLFARFVWLDDDRFLYASRGWSILDDYPVTEWQPGAIWREHQRIYVPAEFYGGRLTLGVELLPGDDVIPIQEMEIQRVSNFQYSEPEMAQDVRVRWENGIQLTGYERTDNGLRFAWTTRHGIAESVQLFVHLLDDDGRIIAQTAGVPQAGERPTTSWMDREYIVTEHDFSEAPAGDYRVRIGWFDPRSGERVMLVDDGDNLLLDERFERE